MQSLLQCFLINLENACTFNIETFINAVRFQQAQPKVSYMGYDEQHPPAHTPGAISERGPATPWNHEDYEFPPSVGPVIYFNII